MLQHFKRLWLILKEKVSKEVKEAIGMIDVIEGNTEENNDNLIEIKIITTKLKLFQKISM
jgi:hypothetical protein